MALIEVINNVLFHLDNNETGSIFTMCVFLYHELLNLLRQKNYYYYLPKWSVQPQYDAVTVIRRLGRRLYRGAS